MVDLVSVWRRSHNGASAWRRSPIASATVALRPEVKLSLIRNTPLFSQCSRREVQQIGSITDQEEHPAGTVVIREGDATGDLYVVVEGAAEVRRGGRKVRTLGIGQCFGELALLTGSARTATVTAATPLELLRFRRGDFDKLLQVSPTIGVKLARSLAQRVESDARAAPL